MPKCPLFWHYEQWKYVKSFFHEKFWEDSVQTAACRRDDLFFVLLQHQLCVHEVSNLRT